jgi:phosphate starvation-inducible PhoH-like protein
LPEEGAEALFGPLDENLKLLEAQFNVQIRTSQKEVIVEGEAADVGRAERVLGQLTTMMDEGYKLGKGDVKTAAQLVAQDENVELAEYFLRGATRTSGKRQVMPKSVNQRRYLDAIDRYDIVFGIGPAGTGKTYLAMAQAVAYLLAKRVSRIILARPAVEAGEKLGFLPGDLQEKVNPYLRPLYDALYDMMEIERADRMIERGTIEVAPIAFMRGRTLNDAFVILDEAQNTTSEQMKMFLTRLGFGSKAVVTGDITQIDLPTGRTSPTAVDPDSRLYVSVTDGRGGRVSDGGLARWLAVVAPSRARGELGVALVSDARMRVLNRSYRGKDYATDVLSFPSDGLGDIVISKGIATRQAREAGHSYQTELRVLALHGLLHLLGYDHDSPNDKGRMARAEARLRRKGGLNAGLISRSKSR